MGFNALKTARGGAVWALGLILLALSACGGGNGNGDAPVAEVKANTAASLPIPEQAAVNPLASAQVENYGVPQDAAAVTKTVERLNRFFADQRAEKKTLEGAQSEPGSGLSENLAQGADAVGIPAVLESAARKTSAPTATVLKSGASPKAAAVPTEAATYRFFNTLTGVHFYTASAAERDSISSKFPYFQYEGIAFYTRSAPADGLHPVYRFYNRVTGTHFYTVSDAERDAVLAKLSDVYTLEGVAWYARTEPATGWRALNRFFNKRTGTHFYTASVDEWQSVLGNEAYSYDGTGYYVKAELTLEPGTWQPPAGVTPATGNYAYFQSQPGDFVGKGRTDLYTPKNATFALSTRYDFPWMEINGSYSWKAVFLPTKSIANWRVGFYPGVTRLNQLMATDLGMDVYSEASTCGASTGWIAVDEVTRDAQGGLVSFELRFEQLCQYSSDVLRGKIRWSKLDLTQPDGPVTPVPANLWRPNPAVVPATGNMVYTEKQVVATDGRFAPYTESRVYTPQNSTDFIVNGNARVDFPSVPLSPAGSPASLGIFINGLDEGDVIGRLTAMSSLARMEVGYYGNIVQLNSMNPAIGGMDWLYNPDGSLNGGCRNYSLGWFAIDDVAYSGEAMTRVNARFEMLCFDVGHGYEQTVRGQVRWAAP